MFDIPAHAIGSDRVSRPSRRGFLRVGAIGSLGLTLPHFLQARAAAEETAGAKTRAQSPRAKAVIQLWMNGGPSQTDTFDPKPKAGPDYCGPYRKPIATNVEGVEIGEMLPLLAKEADKYAVIRSMTHGENGHETASYIMQTGSMPADLVYPTLGAVTSYFRQQSGYEGSLPPYITVPRPLGRFSESGFLGTQYKTFATGGDAKADVVNVQGIVPPGGLTDERLSERGDLLRKIDNLRRWLDQNETLATADQHQQKAYELILGDAKKAFLMKEEDDATRDRYGRTTWGQSFLLARRLVERGVPFITVNWGGWDTHRDNFGRMATLLPELDKAFSSLLADLAERGLLESTIVTWFGEFGRTPKTAKGAPWDDGRHHYGKCFSAVVAGGGFQGGKVVGESDPKGETVKDRPVYPWDLSASMYELLGIDAKGKLPHPHGCVAYVTPPADDKIESGGILTEIM